MCDPQSVSLRMSAQDAALLAPMADRVRSDDISKGKAYNQIVGIVVGSDVKVRAVNFLAQLRSNV
jgi:hypothetical protein